MKKNYDRLVWKACAAAMAWTALGSSTCVADSGMSPDLSLVETQASKTVGDGIRTLRERHQSVRYTFLHVSRSQFSVRRIPNDTAPEADYSIELGEQGKGIKVSQGMRYREIGPLLEFFQVQQPSELTGKSFLGKEGDPFSALNYLALEIKNGGNYAPPSAQTLYQRAAAALWRMEKPDFSRVDDDTVFSAFQAAYNDAEWLQKLGNAISLLSGGRVKLQEADRNEFSTAIMGPAKYLVLSGELPWERNRRQLLIFGPYSTPFTLDPGKKAK